MKITIMADKHNKKTILTLLEEQGCSLPCNCHGQHHCNGNRYSFDCSLIPKAPMTIDFLPSVDSLSALAFHNKETTAGNGDTLLLDIGTTTVAFALIDKKTGALRQMSTAANSLQTYGADVISRIQASCEGHTREMQSLLIDLMKKETRKLCSINKQEPSELLSCYIGGNTTMIHLLMGYCCAPLSGSPFMIEATSPTSFLYEQCEIFIAPWLSAFIGGDIVAGIHACAMNNANDTNLLLDLGTNGEMVLAHNGKLYATSVAAGPAFEAGNLQCGCPSISGAIQNVTIRPLRPTIKTIDNKLPIGLCGSGAISLCAEFIRKGYVTKDGILTNRFPANGYLLGITDNNKPILFTAEDFRQIQLAVAAVAAGIDSLCHKVGISASEVNRVYLGGGFGFHLSLEDGNVLGLFSDLRTEVIEASGNTCLQGLYKCATKNISLDLTVSVETINLADDAYFQKQFIKHMTFPT